VKCTLLRERERADEGLKVCGGGLYDFNDDTWGGGGPLLIIKFYATRQELL
jgi:hypothetical protein